jgi:hypothetical protein
MHRNAPRPVPSPCRTRLVPGVLILALFAGCADSPAGPARAADAAGLPSRTAPAPIPRNAPELPDALVEVVGEYCEVTVIARRTAADEQQPDYDADFFRVTRAEVSGSGGCVATFVDLPVGSHWVFSARNTIVDDEALFTVWPNAFTAPTPTEPALPSQQGAVFVEDVAAGFSLPLTPGNYYTALAAARALGAFEARPIRLQLLPGRVVVCVPGTGAEAFIYTMLPLDRARVPRDPDIQIDPALGHFVDRASTTACVLKGLPNTEAIVEAIDANGTLYRGLVGPDDQTVILEPDPPLERVEYILDGWGDGEPLDIGLVIYGLERAGPNARRAARTAGDVFVVKLDVRGLDRGRSNYEFEVVYGPDHAPVPSQVMRVRVACNEARDGSCRVASVVPSGPGSRLLTPLTIPPADARVDPSTGDGWVTLRFDFTNVSVADLRLRASGPMGVYDYAPDDSRDASLRFRRWQRSPDPGNTFVVRT